MALIDDFKTRFPAFLTAQADTYLPILEPVWPCYYGGSYDDPCGQEIVLNLVAHLLVAETQSSNSATQTVQSRSVGNVSTSYAPGAVSSSERSAWLKTTKYGMRYIMLTRHRQGGVFV